MNAIDPTPTALDRREASGDINPTPDFAQAVKDKSIVARLITPPGLKALLMAMAFAVVNGLAVFVGAEGFSSESALDLAISFALLTLFSLVFGAWLGVICGVIFGKSILRPLDELENRVANLCGETAVRESTDTHPVQTDRGGQIDLRGILYFVLYIFSFPTLGFCVIFSILEGYVYAGSDPLVADLLSPRTFVVSVVQIVSLGACIFLTLWVCARTLILRHRVGRLERESNPAILEADVRAIFPTGISIADRITNAHRQTVRFVTGVF